MCNGVGGNLGSYPWHDNRGVTGAVPFSFVKRGSVCYVYGSIWQHGVEQLT